MKHKEELFMGWQKIAALHFKKSLLPAGGLVLLTALGQLGGFWLRLEETAKQGFRALRYGDGLPRPWGPRLEILMGEGGWYPFFVGGLALLLVALALLPLWMARGGKALASFRRMPVGKWALLLGGAVNAFSWVCCFWAGEFLTLLGCFGLYRLRVPAEVQLSDALLMALLRWDPLNGLFPAARPWLLPLLLTELLALAVIAACTGLYVLGGGLRGWSFGLPITVLSIWLIAVLYKTGLNPLESWYVWTLLAAGAAGYLFLIHKRMGYDPLA